MLVPRTPGIVTQGEDLTSPGWWVSFCEAVPLPQLTLHGHEQQAVFRPVVAEAHGCAVIFSGVLHSELALNEGERENSLDGTPSAAAVILQAYLRRGERILDALKGMFALFLWDTNSRILLCVRDPLGLVPLYYARARQKLLFASSLDVLVHHPQVSPEINRVAFAEHLVHRWPKREETVYTHVKRLPAGHVLRLSNHEQQIFRYWDPAPPHRGLQWANEDDLDQFALLFEQAVSRCVRLGPAAIYLSGGLDSVSVAAFATAQCRRDGMPDPVALSLVFPDPDCNEEAVQRGVTAALRVPQVLTNFDQTVEPEGLLRTALTLSSTLPMPLLNTYAPAYHFLGHVGQQRGCQTILTGGGGDEWLCVSPYYAADLLRRFNLTGLYQLWNAMQRSYPISRWLLLRNVVWRFGVRLLIGEAIKKWTPWVLPLRRRLLQPLPSWLAPDPTLRRSLAERTEETYGDQDIKSLYEREMRRALDHPLVSWEMEETWESGRRLGVVIQQPFWDADLIEFLYRIPPKLLDRGGRTKGLVRQLIARRFPTLGFASQKKVLATNFFCARIVHEGLPAWERMGGVSMLDQIGIVNEKATHSTIPAILAQNHPPHLFRVWELLNLEAWLRAHVR